MTCFFNFIFNFLQDLDKNFNVDKIIFKIIKKNLRLETLDWFSKISFKIYIFYFIIFYFYNFILLILLIIIKYF